jgi:hypothetical protein
MQNTLTFFASLFTMAALALVAILSSPGNGTSVSTKQRRPVAHIPHVTPKMNALLFDCLEQITTTRVSLLDCQVVLSC